MSLPAGSVPLRTAEVCPGLKLIRSGGAGTVGCTVGGKVGWGVGPGRGMINSSVNDVLTGAISEIR